MNPRIAKEIRVLLPAFGLTLSASVLQFLSPKGGVFWMLILFSGGCLIMGALVFGNEFQQKTMSLLLTQPIPRTSIWKEKMLVLGVAIGVGTVILCIRFELSEWQEFSRMDLGWMFFGLISLCAFCTTPWWTLLCRNTLTAALLTLLAPSLILAVNRIVQGELNHSRDAEGNSAIALLLLYCAASCLLGYARFKELQVLDATSSELGLPGRLEALLLRPFSRLSAGFTGPFASLVKKELRLQQISFFGACLFCLVAVAGAALYKWHFAPGRDNNVGVSILAVDFSVYLLLLPFIAGAIGVAEEKAWGVTDWHMTLPPSVLKQWSTKMLVTLSTSLILGLALPSALPLAASVLGPLDHPESLIPEMPILLVPVIGHLLLTSVVVYAATLSSNTLRAIMLAFGLLFVGGCLMKIAGLVVFNYPEVGRLRFPDTAFQIANAFWGNRFPTEGEKAGLVCVEMLIFLCLIQRFAFTCYRNRGMTVFQRTIQALVLAFAVCFLTVAFLILS